MFKKRMTCLKLFLVVLVSCVVTMTNTKFIIGEAISEGSSESSDRAGSGKCSSHPCKHGGTCKNQGKFHVCLCLPKYTGKNCETDIGKCSSHPCQNGGTCTKDVKKYIAYSCRCLRGFTGTSCQTNSNDLILRNNATGIVSKFFNRTWEDYQHGFGSIDSLYWIGLDKLHNLSQRGCGVRFNFQAVDGTWYYAQYSTFLVGDSVDDYRLRIGGYSGNSTIDAMGYHNNFQFSTGDYGPSKFCGSNFYGGWWFAAGGNCCAACLTNSLFLWFNVDTGSVIMLQAAEVRFAC